MSNIHQDTKLQRKNRALWTTVIILATILLVAAFITAASYVGLGPRKAWGVTDFVTPTNTQTQIDVTADCAIDGCLEALKTEHGTFLAFGSSGEAEQWLTWLGDDGRRYQNIVLDLSGLDLTFEERKSAINILFARHDWY